MNLFLRIINVLLITVSCGFYVSAAVSRPPQLVALAFDGSKSLSMWEDTIDFTENNKVAFSYFISAIYLVHNKNAKLLYNPPSGTRISNIGVADNKEDIRLRLEQLNAAINSGNEIGSHAVGHFSGSAWSESQWSSEFAQFNALTIKAYQNNDLGSYEPQTWQLDIANMLKGFRAPFLDTSAGLWPTLRKFGFRYDTSGTSNWNYWPQNKKGFWDFPLPSIPIAGTSRSQLAMDYNFYVAQSNAQPNPAKAKQYEEQMYLSYMNYFKHNYEGNRAPIHIGHHFSLWNDGAYWKALKRFAKSVCELPETKCVTYTELANFLDNHQSYIADYQKGNFEKATNRLALNVQTYDLNINVAKDNSKAIVAKVTGKDKELFANLQMNWLVDGKEVATGEEVNQNSVVSKKDSCSALTVVGTMKDQEIARSTHFVCKDDHQTYISPVNLDKLELRDDEVYYFSSAERKALGLDSDPDDVH